MRLSLSLSAVLIIAGKRRPRAQRWVEICARLCLLGVAPCASFQRKPTWLMVDVLHLLQYYCTSYYALALSRLALARVSTLYQQHRAHHTKRAGTLYVCRDRRGDRRRRGEGRARGSHAHARRSTRISIGAPALESQSQTTRSHITFLALPLL